MNLLEVTLSISLLGIITFIYRYSFISSHGRKVAEKIPQEFLKLLAPATFAAIITNSILYHHIGSEDLKQKTLVATIALLVAYFSKSIVATLVVGLGLLYILQNFKIGFL